MLSVLSFTLTIIGLVACIKINYNTTYILNYIKKRNYPVEVHNVQTDDGYLLTIHRIPYGYNNASDRGIALLVHGLQESAEHWVINNDKSLAFMLSNLGYDVWMMNVRGCYHSREHLRYDTSNSKYWDFSWHEIGVYDLPATINYILSTTKSSNISYIGHSQGATSFFVMTSLKPDYNDKIKIMIALAPAAYMSHVQNPVFKTLSHIWELMYPNKGLLDNVLINALSENLCKDRIVIQNICSNILFLMAGYDYAQLDKNLIPEIMRIMPAGSSTKQLIHYLQSVKSGYFRQYDYLTTENLRRYGEPYPPKYDLEKVTAKVAIYYAKNDWLAVLEDVQRLRDELPNVVVDHLIEYELFNHWDFLFARDVIPLLYNHVIEVLTKYN